jgi:hypothetical protein
VTGVPPKSSKNEEPTTSINLISFGVSAVPSSSAPRSFRCCVVSTECKITPVPSCERNPIRFFVCCDVEGGVGVRDCERTSIRLFSSLFVCEGEGQG